MEFYSAAQFGSFFSNLREQTMTLLNLGSNCSPCFQVYVLTAYFLAFDRVSVSVPFPDSLHASHSECSRENKTDPTSSSGSWSHTLLPLEHKVDKYLCLLRATLSFTVSEGSAEVDFLVPLWPADSKLSPQESSQFEVL